MWRQSKKVSDITYTVNGSEDAQKWNVEKKLLLEEARKIAEGITDIGFKDEITSLITLRDLRPIRSHKIKIEMSKEYNEIMDAAASLDVMSGTFKLNANFKNDYEYKDHIWIEQVVNFVFD